MLQPSPWAFRMPPNSLLVACLSSLAVTTACSPSADHGSSNSATGEVATTTGVAASTTGTAAGGASATAGASGATTGTAGTPGDTRLFVPEGVTAAKLDEMGDDLEVVALTLQQGLGGAELYLALRNVGDDPACDANINIEFFDSSDKSLSAWIGGLYVAQLYTRSDDPGSVLACLDPGGLAMVGTTELPEAVRTSDVATLVYHVSYFAADVLPFDLVPFDALTVTGLEVFETAVGSGFRGAFENGLDVPVIEPQVTIFPMNGVGRPLGLAQVTEQVEIPAGGQWDFETSVVNDTGVDRLVFAGAAPVVQ